MTLSSSTVTSLNLCPKGKIEALKANNRRILSKFSPLEDQLLVYPSAIVPTETLKTPVPQGIYPQDQTIHELKLSPGSSSASSTSSSNTLNNPLYHSTFSLFERLQDHHVFVVSSSSPQEKSSSFSTSKDKRETTFKSENKKIWKEVNVTLNGYKSQLKAQVELLRLSDEQGFKQAKAVYWILSLAEILLIQPQMLKQQQQQIQTSRNIVGSDASSLSSFHSTEWILTKLFDWSQDALVDQTNLSQLMLDIERFPSPKDHSKFWTTVYYCLLRGQDAKGLKILSWHHEYKDPSSFFYQVCELLSQMPKIKGFSSSQHQLFTQKWLAWKSQVHSLNSQAIPSASIQQLLSLMAGNTSTIAQLTEKEDTMVYVMTCLLFTRPTATRKDLGAILKESFVQRQNVFDKALEALCSSDVIGVIRHASKIDAWLAAHLTDVFYHIQYPLLDDVSTIRQVSKELGVSDKLSDKVDLKAIRDFLIESFAEQLFHRGLLMMSLGYYRHAGRRGQANISSILLHLHVHDSFMTNKMLLFCRQHGYVQEYLDIHALLGKEALLQNQYGSALLHYALACRTTEMASVSQLILKAFLHKELSLDSLSALASSISPEFISKQLQLIQVKNEKDLNLLNNLAAERMLHLQFLHQYTEFHVFMKRCEWKQAGALLCLLFTANVAPKSWWAVLLQDTITLVHRSSLDQPRSSPHLIFDTNECFEMMRILQQMSILKINPFLWFDPVTKRVKKLFEEKQDRSQLNEAVNQLHCFLVQQLSQSFIQGAMLI